MKRIKVYVPIILEIYGDDKFEMQLLENSISTEIEHLEDMGIDAYNNGEYELLSND